MAEAIVDGAGRPPARLAVLYDEGCELCRGLKAWLAAQPAVAELAFVAAGSAEARRRFPALDHERTRRVLTVVGDDGSVWEAERAWLVCAWALPRWRPVAERLSGPGGRLAARAGSRLVDGWRHRRSSAACASCAAPPGSARG